MEYIIIILLAASLSATVIFGGRSRARPCTHYEEYVEMTKMLSLLSNKHKDKLAEVRRSADEHIDRWKVTHERDIRRDALSKSRATSRDQATEHLAPLASSLDHLCVKDFRFLGAPIDFVIFNGASKVSDGIEDEVAEIVFLGIETKSKGLSEVQRAIERAILAGNVRFEVFNQDEEV